MDESQLRLLAQIIAVYAFVIILYLYGKCASRRRNLLSNNDVVLPISSGHAPPPLPAAPRPNFAPAQEPSESLEEDHYEIRIFNEGSERGKSRENECPICLSEFIKGESYGLLPACSHKFHADCIMIWLVNSTNKTCPMCRTQVNSTWLINNSFFF